jgi:hypothetical protein
MFIPAQGEVNSSVIAFSKAMDLHLRAALVILGISITLFTSASGQNLIPNPGFETYSGCPSFVAQMNLATGWNNPSGHGGSADYHHVCGTNAWVQVPNNVFGTQSPHAGNAYMGFALFYQSTPEFREYIYCQLTPPGGLTAGTTYSVSWYVSCADNSSMTTDDLQFYVSAAAPTWGSGWNAMTTYTPQCAIPSGTYITNKSGWTLVSATFTAAGGERFLTVGNFLVDAATSMIPNGSGSYNTGYVYFDDGVLQPTVILSADVQALKAVETRQSVHLTWETLSEVGNERFEIERSVADYNHFESIGMRAGAGNSSERLEYGFDDPGFMPGVMNYYRLKAVDQNGTVAYSNAVGVETAPKGDHLIHFFPNPVAAGANLQLTYSLEKAQPISMYLVDLQGREVKSMLHEGNAGLNEIGFPTTNLPAGQYLMRVLCGDELTIRRVTIL